MSSRASSPVAFAANSLRALWVRAWRAFLSLALSIWLWCCASSAAAFPIPGDAGAVNVKAYGAVGDGQHDDTQAILLAIAASQVYGNAGRWPSKWVYFPAGTYLLSQQLLAKDTNGHYRCALALMGEAMEQVTLRLKDNAPGFGEQEHPQAVIYSSSGLLDGGPFSGGKNYPDKGEGNDAYGNYVADMTIDVGSGNPGATGIDYLANNYGAIRNVRVIARNGSGSTGIAMDRKWPGPLLINNVEVRGFNVGISVSHSEYSVTLAHVRLIAQQRVGLRNNGNVVAARDVEIVDAPTAVENIAPGGLIVGDNIRVHSQVAPSKVVNNGYLIAVRSDIDAAPFKMERAFAYFGRQRLATTPSWTLKPTTATPFLEDPSRWVNVRKYGAIADSNQDATHSLQAALDSGASTIYLPAGRYIIRDALRVPSSTRRIVGMGSAIALVNRSEHLARNRGLVRVATDGPSLTIESLTLDNTNGGEQVGVEHSGARQLQLQDLVSAGLRTQRTKTGGRLLLENVCCSPLSVAGQHLIEAMQFNSEGLRTRIENDGAPLLILGLKVEQPCTILQAQNHSATEILGGLIYMVRAVESPPTAFILDGNSTLQASYAESAYRAEAVYQQHITQTDTHGHAHTQGRSALAPRGAFSRIVPFAASPASEAHSPAKTGSP